MDLCPWSDAQFLIFSDNIPTLFFYSHIPAMSIALFVGLFLFYKTKKSTLSYILLFISLAFFVWGFFDLLLWATNRPDTVLFFWSLQVLIEPMIYVLSFYLIYFFIKKTHPHLDLFFVLLLLLLPIIIFLPTNLNLIGVSSLDCNAIEGTIAQYYTYFIEIVLTLIIFVFSLTQYFKQTDLSKKKEIKIFSAGVILFLISFSWGNIIGSFTDDWVLAQAGLIGMPILIAFLGYIIIKFNTFNIKLFAVQALVWGLGIMIGAQFFFIKVPINFALNSVTFIMIMIFGNFLIKSVIKEIRQKEELQKLNTNLQATLQQRDSLAHLITHKVKGSFTRSKYIFAGLLDGSFGDISDQVKMIADKGLKSDDNGIKTVDLILNAANLQKGLVKFESQAIDFKDVVVQAIAEKKIVAESKGLKFEGNVGEGDFKMTGDMFWIKEVVNNLIENAITYTRAGGVVVSLAKTEGNKLLFSVKDTGVGITTEDKNVLFTEGGRGKESLRTNVDSTGYGLFTVRLVVEGHNGKVWVESEGKDKGATFFVKLDLVS
ncbi:MAG: HAMP domain-containing histidine kinase [bacterium]|nr:HAMP domain-containing histidine kinase [bacterium]